MNGIKVFISSAMYELEYEREVAQEVIESLNFEPRIFEMFASQSNSPFQAYMREVRGCDIFGMILWKSLRRAVLEEYQEAVRMCKPILIFIKALSEDEQREKDLKEFIHQLKGETTSSSILYRTVFKEYRKVSEFREILRASIVNEVAKFYRTPFSTLSREEMYNIGTDIIRFSQKRLCLIQRTPSLFFGAREYEAPENQKWQYEADFLSALDEWISAAQKDQKRSLLYLYCPQSSLQEIKSVRTEFSGKFIMKITEKIRQYKKIELNTGKRLRFLPITRPFSGPLAVGDNRFAIWVFGAQDAVAISQSNAKMADVLARMLSAYCSKDMSADAMINQLDWK